MMVDRVVGWASVRPEGLACADDREYVTYGELEARSGRVAAALAAVGVRQGDVVGILVPRSAEFVVAVLGALRAGAAYLPLDADYPVARLAFMVSDSAASVVICAAATAPAARSLGGSCRIVDLAADRELIARAGQPPDLEILPHDACYVIYTSGTTGRPKGVIIEHGNLNHLIGSFTSGGPHGPLPLLTPEDRVLQFSSVSFDGSVFEIFMALAAGAALIIPDRLACLGPDLLDTLDRLEITVATLPANLLSVVEPRALPSTRFMLLIGEGLNVALASSCSVIADIWHGYGPTEATIGTTTTRFVPGQVDAAGVAATRVSLGAVIPGSAVYVLDDEGQPVARGEVGEIYIGGPGVARGYTGDAKMTATRFIPDPFLGNGTRMYRTGDLGTWRADGHLEFRGRSDRQVKIRGYRIELEEIEAVLAALPEVRQAAVLARPAATGTASELVAYVLPGSAACTPASIRTHATRRLPPHMIPPVIHLIDHMPLTTAGKTDLARLPALETSPAQPTPAPAASQNTITSLLLRHWQLVLNRENIGLDDNFFEIGGDSLKAAHVLTGLLGHGHRLTYRDFVAGRSIRGQALLAHPAKELAASQNMEAAPADPDVAGDLIALTPQQLQVWIAGKLEPAIHAYVSQTLLRFRHPLLPEVLESALTQLVSRHDVLRMAVIEVVGVPWQMYSLSASFSLHVLPVTENGRMADGRSTREFITDEQQRPFDLSCPPLARWHLFNYPDGRCELLQTEHHLIHDGWSSILLARDLAVLYTDILGGRRPDPPGSWSYAEYSRITAGQEDEREELAASHARLLDGSPALSTLPLRSPRPRRRQGLSHLHVTRTDEARTRDFNRAARTIGVTPYTIFVAAFAQAFAEVTGMKDFIVGLGMANRNTDADWKTAGMFVNVVPVRMRLAEAEDPITLLRQCEQALAIAQDHSRVSLREIMQHHSDTHDLSRNPLYQVIVSGWDLEGGRICFGPDNDAEVQPILATHSKIDLTVISFSRITRHIGDASPTEYWWQSDTEVVASAVVEDLAARMHEHQVALFSLAEGKE